MKSKIKKSLFLSSVLFCLMTGALAFMPHYSCACGQYADGSYLTHFVNAVSEKIIGKSVIPRNPNPYK